MKNRVFFDMDGVLCQFNEGAAEEEMLVDGFFANMEPRKAMVGAVKDLIQNRHAEVYILSAVIPAKGDAIKAEKNEWLNQYLPEVDESHRIFTLCGESKVDAVNGFNEKDILFDDYSSNLMTWQNAGGRAVKVLNGINGKHGKFKGKRLDIQSYEQLRSAIQEGWVS